MTASYPAFKPVTLPDSQNGNDMHRRIHIAEGDYIQSACQFDSSTRAFVVGVVYAHRSQLESFLNDERMDALVDKNWY